MLYASLLCVNNIQLEVTSKEGTGELQSSYVTLTTNTCGRSKVVKHGYDDLYYKQPRDAWPLTPHILLLARTVLIVEGETPSFVLAHAELIKISVKISLSQVIHETLKSSFVSKLGE